ncbi:MAG: hypothetical protein IT424_00660 [Pirellulales bacterium]|nr:hypothetical protein [Pirellulales bacterium]
MLDELVTLPEGAALTIELVSEAPEGETVFDRLRKFAGTVAGPEDWAKNHDHFIQGTAKLP